METTREIIGDEERLDLLQGVIRDRLRVQMEIPDTPYTWITLLLAIERDRQHQRLVVDLVPDFRRALSSDPEPRIVLSFLDREGVPCSCAARVLAVQPREIWTELPPVIYRHQRRAFYRVPATTGMEIIFQAAEAVRIRAGIKDYGLGGVAFYKDQGEDWFRRLVEEVELRENKIMIPTGKEILEIPISLAVVRRISVFHPEAVRGALEFLRFPESSRVQLNRLIFEHQRQFIQKIKGQAGRPDSPDSRVPRIPGRSLSNFFKINFNIPMKKW